jgi:hypothetical protein
VFRVTPLGNFRVGGWSATSLKAEKKVVDLRQVLGLRR